jgi:diguanylate cyclase (GGDEF)-like protein
MILRRTVRSLDANPLTHLPGNTSIMEELQKCIDSKKIFAVGYADLDKFKVYNDKYGFEKGDEVIRDTARFLIKVIREKTGSETFIGHIGGDDYVFIVDDTVMDDLCKILIKEFDEMAPRFYNEEDRQNGYIIGKDRLGNEIKTGLLSISIGIVSNATRDITHVAQISEIGAELKKYAKSFLKSNFVRDQRKNNR